MKKTVIVWTILAALALSLGGCGKRPAAENQAPGQPMPAGTAAPEAAERQDGERFEAVIILEGMEETVQYEHIVNRTAGFAMDYDYVSFARRSEADRERFLSVWDDPARPENYLEVSYRPEDAEAVAASYVETLSRDYEVTRDSRELDRAGSCTRIEASVIKNTNRMAEQLQAVYIIPAPDGCRVATTHCFIAEAEGFGRRFDYMINTLAVIDRRGEGALSDEEALSAIRRYCFITNPDLEEIAAAEDAPVYWDIASSDAQEIVVVYRSYTGALVRYYIDRVTGDAYVTEFVPGITPEEERTEESLNVRDYLD